jgi:hypothetical protein
MESLDTILVPGVMCSLVRMNLVHERLFGNKERTLEESL